MKAVFIVITVIFGVLAFVGMLSGNSIIISIGLGGATFFLVIGESVG
jgi:hypothetical protein